MKKYRLLMIVLLFVVITGSACSQVMGNFQYRTQQVFKQSEVQQSDRRPVTNARIPHNHEMTITVNGLANLLATDYVAVFNIIQVAPDMRSAVAIMNSRIDSFKIKLLLSGIEAKDINVDLISFVPRYDYKMKRRLFSKTYNEIPAGFELQQNITVRYRKSTELPAIIAAAAESEIYDIVKVDYFVENIQHLIDSLRHGCLKEVVTREKSLSMLGMRMDTLRKVVAEDFTTIYPPTRYFSYQAFSRPSLEAANSGDKLNMAETPYITEKPVSRFYQQVHYDYYDIIRDAVIKEPVIQISYTVTVKYFLKDEVSPPKNRYFMITPNGDIRQIDPS